MPNLYETSHNPTVFASAQTYLITLDITETATELDKTVPIPNQALLNITGTSLDYAMPAHFNAISHTAVAMPC